MTEPVEVSRQGLRATITLARPERGNALGAEMVAAIDAALDAALADGARFILFRGTGRNFCTGLDLSDLGEMSEGDLALRILRIEILLQRIHDLPVTTAAVAAGRVFGAGADLGSSGGIPTALLGGGCVIASSFSAILLAVFFGLCGLLSGDGLNPLPDLLLAIHRRHRWPSLNPRASPHT